MDFSNPVKAIIPSLEGEVYLVLSRTTTPLSSLRIASLAPTGSRQGIRLALERLVRQGTVTATPSSSMTLYSANREHLLWHAIEAAVRLADRSLLDLKGRLSDLALARQKADITLALFGSVARGDSEAGSDIDLLAVFPSPGMTEEDESLVDEITTEVPRWTGNDCNVYPVTRTRLAEMVEQEDPMIASWLRDAETISGPDLRILLEHHPSTRRR